MLEVSPKLGPVHTLGPGNLRSVYREPLSDFAAICTPSMTPTAYACMRSPVLVSSASAYTAGAIARRRKLLDRMNCSRSCGEFVVLS